MKPTTTRTNDTVRRGCARSAAALLICLLAAPLAQAQLDPLISLKRVPPRIVIVFDTSFEMLYDATNGGTVYCDPVVYTRAADNSMATTLGVPATQATYGRSFTGLKVEADGTFSASGVTWYDPAASPCGRTRLEVARAGVALALARSGNPRLHFGLVRLRQTTPAWRIAPSNPCSKVQVLNSSGLPLWADYDKAPCNVGAGWVAFNPATNGGANASAAAPLGAYTPSAPNTATSLLVNVFNKPLLQSPLIATGRPSATMEDRPLALTLDDARKEVERAMAADTGLAAARNTVVVLIAGGKDYSGDPASKAATFLSVTSGGATRRVPIFVVGVNPKEESQLQLIATSSGGLYSRANTAEGVERVINLALQAGCQRAGDFDAGRASEYPLVSPVIGTVNLDNAESASGVALPESVVKTVQGNVIPQRNNIMLTASFALGRNSLTPDSESWNPGFEGRLRAFRVFKPVADSSRPSGYNFTKDGTPLWPDRDGRSYLAGMARTHSDPASRNIYTQLPGSTVLTPFDVANLPSFASALALPAAKAGMAPWLVTLVRGLPLGAIISSTPAVMDPPSLDPPPDDDYGRTDVADSYAGKHKDRRSIIFVGANDGMLHAIDARTGYEVWAFIPYNLLPKLQTLFDGQSPYEFSYFVDHSPKIAEVKMGGVWKSLLIIGEGWGGTFYQAFDVTEAGMGGPAPDSDDHNAVIGSFNADRIQFLWSFPDYAQFDPTLVAKRVVAADSTSFGRVKFFGDLLASASTAEKKMGFTWSDPAVGALDTARSVNAAIVGSGYFPPEADQSSSSDVLPARSGVGGVGHTFYLINLATGKLVGNTGGSGCTGSGCLDVGDAGGNRPKNGLQADPTVTSDYGSYVARKAYMGDLQGNYYRFDFNSSGAITRTVLKSTSQPIYASSALMWVGSAAQYIFFATGSDMLPSSPTTTFGTGTFKLYGIRDSGGTVADAFTAFDLATVTNLTPENPVVNDVKGKAVGIPSGERPSTSPSVAGEIVFFTTTTEAATASAEPTYQLYAITYKGTNGYPPTGTTSGGGGGNGGGGNKPPKVSLAPIKSGEGRATAPFVVDQHLYFATSSGSSANVEAFGDPNDFNNGVGQVGVRILSWREIRR